MTIWAFISDVHGNLPALEFAIRECRGRGADRLVYLGDLLGRGDSDACVRLVRATAALSVVGNRDLDWQNRVGPEARVYVRGLPRYAEAADFVCTHGDRRLHHDLNTDQAREGFRRAYLWLRKRGRRLAFFGHSHRARVWRKSGPDSRLDHLSGLRVELPSEPGTVYLVNVGTTGLPFPGKGPPSCAVYDDRARVLEHIALGPGRGSPVGLNL